jgi:hypothetical protein
MKNFVPWMIASLLLAAAISCTTIKTNADGEPDENGGYETKKAFWITYSHKPEESLSEEADAKIMNFLLGCSAFSFIVFLFGAVSWALDRTKRFPNDWWDECLIGGGAGTCVCLSSIFFYPLLKWIILVGVATFIAYRIYKEFRLKRKGDQDGQADTTE